MILELSLIEKLFCMGGDYCDCICWKSINNEYGYEIIFGEVAGVNLDVGFMDVSLGAATKCRMECNLNGYKFRRCDVSYLDKLFFYANRNNFY